MLNVFNPALSVANVESPWLYALFAFVIAFVIAQCLYYLIKSLRRAKALNMDMTKIKQVIIRSLSFSILPSIGIFIGVVTLIGALGTPLPAIRLSIIGALQYETMAAGWAADAITGAEGGLGALAGNITGTQYVTIATAMTIGIIWGPLFMLFLYKKFQPKMNKVSTSSGSRWNDIMFGAVFVGMVMSFLCVAVAGAIKNPTSLYGYINLIAVVVSALIMWLCDLIVKKYKQNWLENFSLALSMIAGMAVVAILSYNFPAPVVDAASSALVALFM